MTGKVVTFYSPRGEPERGMTLSNLAWMLAEEGKRVLAVDAELNSPSLDQYFQRFTDPSDVAARPGVIDLLSKLLAPPHDGRRSSKTELANSIVPVKRTFAGSGKIDLLLGLGARDGDYADIDWQALYADPELSKVLHGLRSEMGRSYDYILVNTQSGLTDQTRAGLVFSPDRVLVCFTPRDRSIADAAKAMQGLVAQGKRPHRLPVVFGVDPADHSVLQSARRRMGEAFHAPLGLTDKQAMEFRPDGEIPHFESELDSLLAGADNASPHKDQLRAAYRRLLDAIKRDTRQAAAAATTADVLISFASADRLWAQWVASRLGRMGLRANFHAIDQSDDLGLLTRAMDLVDRTIVLASPRYLEAAEPTQALTIVSAVPSSVFAALDMSATELPARATLTLSNSEKEALAALQTVFGRGGQPAQAPVSPWQPAYPGAGPTTINVTAHNDAFAGRIDLLDEIRSQLTDVDRGAAPIVLMGQAGIGKTSLALEYVRRFEADYSIVWWIPAESRALATAALFDLADRLGIVDGETPSIDTLFARFERAPAEERWLLVFDSADQPDEIEDLIKRGNGHVLITSAAPSTTKLVETTASKVITVKPFDRQESIALLKRRQPNLADADADRLAGYFEDFPLVLNQVGLFLSSTSVSVEEYLDRVAAIDLATMSPVPTASDAKIAVAWRVALDEVSKRMPAAASAFLAMTFLAPEPIPHSVCFGRSLMLKLAKLHPGLEAHTAEMYIRQHFTRFGLARVQPDDSSIRILRVVQRIMREAQSGEEARRNQELAFEVLADADPDDPDDSDNWPKYQALWPHFESPDLLSAEQESVYQLVANLIRYRYKLGDYVGSLSLAERVLNSWSESPSSFIHLMVVGLHKANALRKLGRFGDAQVEDEDVLVRLRAKRGGNDYYTLLAESGLAADHRAHDDYQEALDLDRHTVQQATDDYGADAPRTLMFASNHAMSLRMMGQAQAAAEANRDTFNQRMQVLGADHPFTWFSANSYGRDLRDLGRFDQSREWLERAHENYRRIYGGDDHPDTLWVSKNLSVTYRRLGLFQKAHQLITNTSTLANNKLGPQHPESLICQMTTATTFSALPKHDLALLAAEKSVQQISERLRTRLGDQHVYTMLARNNQAAIQIRAGVTTMKPEDLAEIYHELATRLVETHWILAIVSLTIGNLHHRDGAFWPAVLIDERAYKNLLNGFGEVHPDTICAAINLAISRRDNGDVAGAEKLMGRARRLAEESASSGPGASNLRLRAAEQWERWTYTFVDPPPLT